MISRNHDLTNNEIESINGNHAKLKAAHEKLKAEVEAQNKFNSDNQVDITVKIIDKKLTITTQKTFASWLVLHLGQCGQGAEEAEWGEEHYKLRHWHDQAQHSHIAHDDDNYYIIMMVLIWWEYDNLNLPPISITMTNSQWQCWQKKSAKEIQTTKSDLIIILWREVAGRSWWMEEK